MTIAQKMAQSLKSAQFIVSLVPVVMFFSTLFTDANSNMRDCQERNFLARFLTTNCFETEAEHAIANDTEYGLSGYIWTEPARRCVWLTWF